MTLNKLNRFTTLPVLFDLLRTKRFTFGNPEYWPDKNDSELLLEYGKRRRGARIYAICFLEGNETIHHWNAFASGMDGCCIEFDAAGLKSAFLNLGVKCEDVEYMKLDDPLPSVDKFPFTKREPYTCEGEVRAIWEGRKNSHGYVAKIDLGLIRKITISPTMPEELFPIIRNYLRDKFKVRAKINHSTIFRNCKWIQKFRDAPPNGRAST
ncbi:MAG: hypothetical protein IH623_30395 [Verrucomicrobia bacterium]|nr:hypothetical protein [Verrucomicrobiota bacterium]